MPKHGQICYIEIPAGDDPKQSADFYAGIFGWPVRSRGDGNLAFDDPNGVSGTWVGAKDRTPGEAMRTYVCVDSIDETVRKIEAGGGRITTPKQRIPGGGFFAIFEDPTGVELGLYEGP